MDLAYETLIEATQSTPQWYETKNWLFWDCCNSFHDNIYVKVSDVFDR